MTKINICVLNKTWIPQLDDFRIMSMVAIMKLGLNFHSQIYLITTAVLILFPDVFTCIALYNSIYSYKESSESLYK